MSQTQFEPVSDADSGEVSIASGRLPDPELFRKTLENTKVTV